MAITQNSITFKNFADWCRHQDRLPPNTQRTVDLLWQEAGKFDNDCDKAFERLSNRNGLGFAYKKINDLRPFQSLINLKRLSLDNNRIKDLKPLRSLTNLESLSLAGNKITDLSSLGTLGNLRELNLSNNQISDFAPLSPLTKLEKLSIYGNPAFDLSPLKSLTNLKFLSLNPFSPNFLQPFQERCEQAVYSTQSIDPWKATQAVKTAYAAIDQGIPEVMICRNLVEVEAQLKKLLDIQDDWELWFQHQESVDEQLHEALKDEVRFISSDDDFYLLSDSLLEDAIIEFSAWDKYLWLRAYQQIGRPLKSQLCFWSTEALLRCNPMSKGWQRGVRSAGLLWLRPAWSREQEILWSVSESWSREYPLMKAWFLDNTITSIDLLDGIHLFDFYITMLDGTLNAQQRHAYQCLNQLVEQCGWIIPFEKVCLVCDRPQ